jgi:1-deoxy-D-xylulose-5-phosphate synthase
VAIYSTFMQRAVDQVVHDVAFPGLPVVFALDRAGFVSGDGETHQGLLDIGLFGSVPGLAMIAPANGAEVRLGLCWALAQERPVMLRYPKAACGPELEELSAPMEEGKGVFVRFFQSEVLLMSVGALLPEVLAAAHLLNCAGISADIYNMRFVKPIDQEYLSSVLRLYDHAVMVEEGAARGGVGEYVSRLLCNRRERTVSFHTLAAADEFPDQGSRDQMLAAAGLDGPGIAAFVRGVLE